MATDAMITGTTTQPGKKRIPANVHKVIYWHRELPPFSAEALGEHILDANSPRIPGNLAHRDELWDRCYEDLMAQARDRITQEVCRLGGNCAHVLSESIAGQHDERTGESWLHGRFNYVLYRQPESNEIQTGRITPSP